jgi:hypothetical protein
MSPTLLQLTTQDLTKPLPLTAVHKPQQQVPQPTPAAAAAAAK